jgi:hypothetical protein
MSEFMAGVLVYNALTGAPEAPTQDQADEMFKAYLAKNFGKRRKVGGLSLLRCGEQPLPPWRITDGAWGS